MVPIGSSRYPRGGVNIVKGKYLIERRLGGGGMAEVFLARTLGAEGFSRQVAIKRVLAGFSERPEFAQMFITEAQLTSRLQHPNIVSTLDFDRDEDGRLFLVLELVEGTDLDGLLCTGPLPFGVVIHLITEILHGLDYAHALPIGSDGLRGIVHRDISPHNVLLSWEGAVKVSDFGIAKAHAASNASASILIKGKPAYMSPEQANGLPLDGRSDLFAVGVMLFEMLVLQPLFAGATTQETLSRLLFSPIPDVRKLRSEIPEDLARVVASLLARERNLRVASAQAAIAALVACADYPREGRAELMKTLSQRFMGRVPSRSRGSIRPLPADAAPIAAPPLAVSPVRRGTQTMPSDEHRARSRKLWPVLVVVLVAIGAVGAVVASTRSAKPIATVPSTSRDTALPTPGSAAQIPAARAPSSGPVAPVLGEPDAPSASAAVTEGSASSTGRESKSTSTAPPPAHEPALKKSAHRPSRGPKQNPEGIREIQLSKPR